MNRLKPKEVAAFREALAKAQNNHCALCGGIMPLTGQHLDHDHKTGLVRGVLHRECNNLLGKVENFFNGYGKNMNKVEFLAGVMTYLTKPPGEVYHYTHRTNEEKRLARNRKARLRRKK